MRLTIAFLTSIFCSCSTSRDSNSKSDFLTYSESLEKLNTPISFDTKGNNIKVLFKNYDTAMFEVFRYAGCIRPHGKIFVNDSIVVLVDIAAGDVIVPVLTTFNLQGQKLDSINPWNKSGWGIGYESYEFLTINDKKEIVVIDSTTTSELNETEDHIIEGTEKLTVDTVIYVIDKRGKIIKKKE
ncbi:MAG: hypothetical protein MUF43_02930 [Flavobacterium sp.]|jgi:hypothetical protein|nr:hypothetical protein [Flavobacterium sp.]